MYLRWHWRLFEAIEYLLSSIKHTNPDLQVVAILVNCQKAVVNEFSSAYLIISYWTLIDKNYQKGDILSWK